MFRFLREPLFAIIFLFAPFFTFAQNAIINGQVLDEDEDPIAYATIAIYDSTGTNLLTGTQAGLNGFFEVELRSGTYHIEISSLSFHAFKEEISLEAGDEFEFGAI